MKVRCDAAEPWQMGYQEPATRVMEGIEDLHDEIMYIIIVITVVVMWMMGVIVKKYKEKGVTHKHIRHGTMIEIVWTVTPAIVLVTIALPSLKLLYLSDEVIDPVVTIKAIGHQWYWTYEYSDYNKEDGEAMGYDSYMVPTEDLKIGGLRLLEVDNRVVVPVRSEVRIVVTSTDVMHAWAIPSLGVKIDCIPGRLNQTAIMVKREGVYYGQCSELCGVQHGYMPIVVEAVPVEKYVSWVMSRMEENT